MDFRAANTRDVTLLSVAVVLGAVMAPIVGVVGLPIAAAGLAGLAYRGHTVAAALAAALGVAAAAVVRPIDAAFVGPMLLVVLAAVTLLPKRGTQRVAPFLIGGIMVVSVAFDELLARTQGTTLTAQVAEQTKVIAKELGASLAGVVQADVIAKLDEVAKTMSNAWPSAYFESAVLAGVLVIVAIAWAARRADRDLDVPPLARLDLSPHVLWAFVLGLLLLAVSYVSFSASTLVGAVGLNLVLCARTLFFLQGLGVSAGVLDRAGVGLGGRIFALAALAALDAFTLVVSFIGLVDFWINFRRLPRDGVTPDAPADPADAGRRW